MKGLRVPFLAFLGGSLFFLFFNLWGRSLENHDYLRYAEVAKEMIRSGDWVVPRLNGEIFLHKPPLLFWLIAIPSKLYGEVTPFLARLPSALFAWIGVLVVYFWGRTLWKGERYGLISAGVLLSSYLYFWQGRIARTDMVFSVLILLSLYFFYLAYPGRKIGLHGLSFFFMGLAGLTKGPVGILFPLSLMILFLMTRRELRLLLRKEFLIGYLGVVFLFGLWLVPFLHHVGWDEALRVWRETKILTRKAPFYLYGYRVWLDFAPWSIFLPSLVLYYWKKERNPDETFLILWFLGLFSLLTLFPVRAPKYLLPALPALALLMGGFWRTRAPILLGVISLAAIVTWHGYELKLIQGNEKRSRGMVIEKALRPYRKENLFAYQMDVDLLTKINFYGDPIVPQVKGIEGLIQATAGKKEAFVITPQKVAEGLIEVGFRITPIKFIENKGMNFLLVKIHPS
ncbi:MAG: glycosyltransferase family 39 protein [Desulfobacterota bacterium]|nr:glycosyltransferase family 39 protein [Thermodesulfobacteriota bacterium]